VLKKIAEVKRDTQKIQDILKSADTNEIKKGLISTALIKFSKYEADFAKGQ
jgi:methyl-accepting chemotaxis protein